MAGKKLFRQADTILTMAPAAAKAGRHIQETDLGVLKNASMLVEDGQIIWVGPHANLPKEFAKKKIKEISMKGQTILPGLVECHSHTIFSGHRAEEFEMRNNGVSYSEIASKGGGILSTMKKTRATSKAVLQKTAQSYVDVFVAQGVTTLEVKSGYALDKAGEIKMLQVAKALKGPRIVKTFLGAHALPPEYSSYTDYLLYLETELLPELKKKKLADRVDAFVEKGFFPVDAAKKYLMAAKELGFEIAIHADQLNLSGGTALAIALGAHSADHVLQISDQEIRALANSRTVAVLLPAADLYMKCNYPPARRLIESGACVALATDFNPGSSPTQDLALVGLLARLEMKMTLPEVLGAYTVGAAIALGKLNDCGSLERNKRADFFSTSDDWQTLFYSVGHKSATEVFVNGQEVFTKPS